LAEYRLDELAKISGVSARNIRAYRERGLLDPPRRVGRAALYDDYHFSQLRTITQLLNRGFNSAHIAEFFASMRQGADLADILGIQRALLGPRADGYPEGVSDQATPQDGGPASVGQHVIDIDPAGSEARKLIESGLAEMRNGRVVCLDPRIAEILGRTKDHLLYVRALLQICDSTRNAIDGLALAFLQALEQCVEAKLGDEHVLRGSEIDELERITQDYRDLWDRVVSDRLSESLRRQQSAAISRYTTGVLSEAGRQ
jgi:DNA-binding transcriptional MerR regulator